MGNLCNTETTNNLRHVELSDDGKHNDKLSNNKEKIMRRNEKANSRDIDKYLQNEKLQYIEKKKILILGCGSCGKSTYVHLSDHHILKLLREY